MTDDIFHHIDNGNDIYLHCEHYDLDTHCDAWQLLSQESDKMIESQESVWIDTTINTTNATDIKYQMISSSKKPDRSHNKSKKEVNFADAETDDDRQFMWAMILLTALIIVGVAVLFSLKLFLVNKFQIVN